MFYLAWANFIVLCLTLACLIWYTRETSQIKRSSLRQVESMQAPCLVVDASQRDPTEGIIRPGAIVGGMTVKPTSGCVTLVNIGKGPALNVHYELQRLDAQEGKDSAASEDYLQVIATEGKQHTHISNSTLRSHRFRLVAKYEGLSRNRYETRMTIEGTVLTSIKFLPPV